MDWNEFTGHNTGWDSNDTTEYASTTRLDEAASFNLVDRLTEANYASDEIVLNAQSKTDIKADSTFALTILEQECYYADDLTGGRTEPVGTSGRGGTELYTWQVDHSVVANRPYLDITTSVVTPPTDNATFFGNNF